MKKKETVLSVLKDIRSLLKKKDPAPGVTSGRFIKNQNGTVTDTSTGFMWGSTFPVEMTFSEAEKACKELSVGGHKDWRLPTVKELITLLDYDRIKPAIDKDAFPDTKSSWYWSGTPYKGGSGGAWIVDFGDGYVSTSSKGNRYCVRPVRSSQ